MQLEERKLTKAEWARINGSKGRGPVTAEGKDIVARNSLKHGLAAKRFAVLEEEDPQEYEMLRVSVFRRLNPADEQEQKMALTMVNAEWRLRRIERWERDAAKMEKYKNLYFYERDLLRQYKRAVDALAVHRAANRGRRRKASVATLLLPLLSIA